MFDLISFILVGIYVIWLSSNYLSINDHPEVRTYRVDVKVLNYNATNNKMIDVTIKVYVHSLF